MTHLFFLLVYQLNVTGIENEKPKIVTTNDEKN